MGSLKHFLRRNRRVIPLFGAVIVFGGLGIYFLRGSHAQTVGDGASITLMPQVAEVKRGGYMNVAVNIDTKGVDSKAVKAIIKYPGDSLLLESVEQVCPKPAFDNTTAQETKLSGTVTIGCESTAGFSDKQTVAYLVFKGVADAGDVSVSVDQQSEIIAKDESTSVKYATQESQLTMRSRDYVDNTPRAVRSYGHKPADCANAPAGHVRCHAEVATGADGQPLNDDISPRAATFVDGYGPIQLHTAYQIPCTPGGPVAAICATPKTYDRNIVITIGGSYTGGVTALESDLTTFSQYFGIPPCTIASGCLTVMSSTGSTTSLPADAGSGTEIALDMEAIHAICQTCKITVVMAKTTSTTDMAAGVKYAATHLSPYAINMSWGATDVPLTGNTSIDESNFKFNGMYVVGTTGDNGVIPDKTNWPTDYGSVLSVAGTTLKLNADYTRNTETVWSGSGGGCSPTNAAPQWQKDLSNWSTVGCGSQRANGDVSADADPATGLAVVYGGKGKIIGGTSLAGPIISAMTGLSEKIGDFMGPQYPFAYTTAANTYDVTSGNDCLSTYTKHCTAGTGFDTPSGLGAPKGLGWFRTSVPAQTDTQKPTVSFTAPTDGEVVTGTAYKITLNISDNSAVAAFTVQIDNNTPSVFYSLPYSATMDTTSLANGTHTLKSVVTDSAGNQSTATRTFRIGAAPTPPTPTPPTPTPPTPTPPTPTPPTPTPPTPTPPTPTPPTPTPPTPTPVSTPGDINGDKKVNLTDLSRLLSAWNTNNTAADLNKSGKVDLTDLSILLAHWTG